MTPKPYLQDDWSTIKGSGLLSHERITELEAELDRRIRPLIVDGKDIPSARLVDAPSSCYIIMVEAQGSYSLMDYHRKGLLAELMTPEELKTLNDFASTCFEEKREATNYANAAKVSDREYEGGVWWGDDYFGEMEEMLDRLMWDCEDPEDIPEYVWAAKPTVVIPELDASDVVEHYVCDRGWEDMDVNDLNGVDELQAALDAFVKANEGVVSYYPDHKLAVVISPETRAELVAQMKTS